MSCGVFYLYSGQHQTEPSEVERMSKQDYPDLFSKAKKFMQYHTGNMPFWMTIDGTNYTGFCASSGGSNKKVHRKGSYESMTLEELKKKCSVKGIKHSGLRKADVIRALRK